MASEINRPAAHKCALVALYRQLSDQQQQVAVVVSVVVFAVAVVFRGLSVAKRV